MPKVSVIVPCYNQGHYVDEAIESVLSQTYQDFEIIVIDDGSTDEATVRKLKSYDRPRTRVLRTTNQGLAAARNRGIREAAGKYILPLDADDKIGPTYAEKAVRILDADERVGIVYCEPEFFGAITGRWEIPPYQLSKMLVINQIFCAGFFRKADWALTGGYNPMWGWEDYDFWLSVIALGREVVQIPEVLFYYRRMPGSMIEAMTRQDQIAAYARIFRNHRDLYIKNIDAVFGHIVELREDLRDRDRYIAYMESSRLWKVRDKLVRLKSLLGASRRRGRNHNVQS